MRMGEEKKTISQGKLKILLAKHIKKHSKHLGDKSCEILNFDFKWNELTTAFIFGGETYVIDGFWKLSDLLPIVEEAFKETGCDGVVFRDGATIRAVLY